MKVSKWSFVLIKTLFCSVLSVSAATDPCYDLANDPNQYTFSLNGFCHVIYQSDRQIGSINEVFCLARKNGTVAIPSAQVITQTDKLIGSEYFYWTSMYHHSNSTPKCTCKNKFLKTECQATDDEINDEHIVSVCDRADASQWNDGCVFLSLFDIPVQQSSTLVYKCESPTAGVICQYGAPDPNYLSCPSSLPAYEYVKRVGTECYFVVRTTQIRSKSLVSACQAVNSEAQMANNGDIRYIGVEGNSSLFRGMFNGAIGILATNSKALFSGLKEAENEPLVEIIFNSEDDVLRAEYSLTACVVSEHVWRTSNAGKPPTYYQ